MVSVLLLELRDYPTLDVLPVHLQSKESDHASQASTKQASCNVSKRRKVLAERSYLCEKQLLLCVDERWGRTARVLGLESGLLRSSRLILFQQSLLLRVFQCILNKLQHHTAIKRSEHLNERIVRVLFLRIQTIPGITPLRLVPTPCTTSMKDTSRENEDDNIYCERRGSRWPSLSWFRRVLKHL
jgi:hypothetical protein